MKTISPVALQKLLDVHPSLPLLDVRTPVEFAEVHVAHARNEPLDQLEPKILYGAGCLPKGCPVYILCRSGGRAIKAAELFAREGYDNAIVVAGGTQAWCVAGLPVDRRAVQVVGLKRQVRIAAGSIMLAGILLAWFVHPGFLGLLALAGAGLIYAGITDWCVMGLLLAKLPGNQKLPPTNCVTVSNQQDP